MKFHPTPRTLKFKVTEEYFKSVLQREPESQEDFDNFVATIVDYFQLGIDIHHDRVPDVVAAMSAKEKSQFILDGTADVEVES